MRFTDLIESDIPGKSSRDRRIDMLRAELNDKRMRKSNYYDTYVENLQAWIDYIGKMSDEDYERDRQKWVTDEFPIESGIDRSGRDFHPEDVLWSARTGNSLLSRKNQIKAIRARPSRA